MKLSILSNVNLNSLCFRLKRNYEVYTPDGYDTWTQELLMHGSSFYESSPTDCFIILNGDTLQAIEAAAGAIGMAARSLPDCHFYISTLDCRDAEYTSLKASALSCGRELEWLDQAQTLRRSHDNIYVFDLKGFIMEHGRDHIYSSKMWYASASPFSASGEKLLMHEIESILNARYNVRKKCIVLDLDNTLWGGVIGEDDEIDLDTVKEGARYRDFQKKLRNIQNTGVLLAIASKNNIDDARRGFDHPAMLLKWEDFAAHKVNWLPKPVNIKEIAEELNLGLDAFVFIDDNPRERQEMILSHTEVAVPDFPEDTCKLAQFADQLYRKYFQAQDLTAEDGRKAEMYRTEMLRAQNKHKFTSLSDFLSDMKITLSLRAATVDTMPRVLQLLHKTNQFNLTTRRHDEQTVRAMLGDSNYIVLLGRVGDKFGDSGESLLIIAKWAGSESIEIDSFVMSCRIMGRTIEYAAIDAFERLASAGGANYVSAFYCPTAKNEPCGGFYPAAGYSLQEMASDGRSVFKRDLARKKNDREPYYVKVDLHSEELIL